jgi:hypothetical protein
MKQLKFKIGADPELFMADQAGVLKAACGRIGGTKDAPQELGIGEGFFVQEDNVAIEFNIPPANSADELKSHLSRAIKELANGVKTMYNFQIVNLSAASFPAEELTTPASQIFGCDPDFNAWTTRKNPRPAAVDKNLRSCGGHIHIGVEDPDKWDRYAIVKAMDLYLGVPSVIMDRGELRKRLYGKYGAHRIKPYGVEYRTLSNFWVFDDKLIEWVWNNTGKALTAVDARSIDFDSEQEAIRTAIDNNDKATAQRLIDKYELEIVNV